MNETVKTYISKLSAPQLVTLIEINGHANPVDPRNVDALRGYLTAMVARDEVAIVADINPFTGRTSSDLRARLSDATERADAAKTAATEKKYRTRIVEIGKELRLVPTVYVLEKQNEDEYRERDLRNMLEKYVTAARELRGKLAEKIAESDGSALGTIEWLGGRVEAMQLGLWARVALEQAREDDVSLVDVVTEQVRNISDALIGNRWRSGSSSQFANVVDGEKREAAHRYITDLRLFANIG